MRKHFLSGLLILFAFLILSQTAQARDYTIELIVFEQAGGSADADAEEDEQDEKWDFSDRKIADKLQRLAELESRSDAFRTETTLHRLEPARQQLAQAGHRILRTAGWIQPSAVYQHAPLISLDLPDSSLAGFIRVYKTSLIYADIDLQFSPKNSATPMLYDSESSAVPVLHDLSSGLPTLSDNLPERYFLSEKRRLKFKEAHYFDHPKFGAILGIWPTR